MKWVIVPFERNPCPECSGGGSEWKKRKDGQVDRRYFFPVGPCPACGGSGSGQVKPGDQKRRVY